MPEESLSAILPPVVWSCDAEGLCLSLSAAWSSITGAPAEAGLGWGFLDFVHPDDRAAVLSQFESAQIDGHTYQVEYRLKLRDGSYRYFLDTAQAEFRDGRFHGYTGAIIDNRARREAEQLVRNREREMRLVTDAVPVLIAHIDSDERYRFANAAYRDWYGVEPDSLVGKKVAELLGPERYAERIPFIKAALAGERVTYDGLITLKNGETRNVETIYAPRICEAGNADGFIAVVNDITDRKRSYEQMQLMVGELKHHTANLLTMVQALARRNLKQAVGSDEYRNFESQLLALGAVSEAIAPGNFRQVLIRALVERITAPHREPGRDQFEIDGDELSLPNSLAISFAMMLHELCTNAVKYGALSVPQGVVRLRWSLVGGRFQLRWQEDGGPPVAEPIRQGFGTTLLNRALPDAVAHVDFRPEGLVFTVTGEIKS